MDHLFVALELPQSASAYCFSHGSSVTSWMSKKQDSVAQSTAEAEYVAAAEAAKQTIWLKRILNDMGKKKQGSIELYCVTTSRPLQSQRIRFITVELSTSLSCIII